MAGRGRGAHVHACMHAQRQSRCERTFVHARRRPMGAHVCARMHASINACKHECTQASMNARNRACMHASINACKQACMQASMHASEYEWMRSGGKA
eukprot:168137-Chlamydomonas_euryale.AAC.5